MFSSSSASKTPGHGCSDFSNTAVLVGGFDGCHRAERCNPDAAVQLVVAGRALQIPHHVFGRQFTTGVKLDTLAQVELELLAVAAPVERLDQARLWHEFLVLLQQAVPHSEQALAAAAEILSVEREQVRRPCRIATCRPTAAARHWPLAQQPPRWRNQSLTARPPAHWPGRAAGVHAAARPTARPLPMTLSASRRRQSHRHARYLPYQISARCADEYFV